MNNLKCIPAVRIVIDTNVFINSIGKISPYRWIFDGIVSGQITLCISNDIFYEYWEILERQTSAEIARNVVNFLVTIPSVEFITPFMKWNLIEADKDDNKFVDCAISCGAWCIITHDNHFQVLKSIKFPSVRVFDPETFREVFNP